MSDQVEICSERLRKIKTKNLGTQDFFNSVTTLLINYEDKEGNVFKDLDIAHEYFKNLKYIHLKHIVDLSLADLIEILFKCRINHISFTRNSIKKSNKNSFVKPFLDISSINPRSSSKYWIESKDGCVIFYEKNNQQFVNFKNLKL